MFISRESYEKLLVAYDHCVGFSAIESEYKALFDVVGECLNEIEEYGYDAEDGEPNLEVRS